MRARWVEGGLDKTATRRDERLMNKHSRQIRMVLNTSPMFPVWFPRTIVLFTRNVAWAWLTPPCFSSADMEIEQYSTCKCKKNSRLMDACVTCVAVGGDLAEYLITIVLVVMTDFVNLFCNCFLSPSHYYIQKPPELKRCTD